MKTIQISKCWGKCKESDDLHWAFYTFLDESDEAYWRDEHIDEENSLYWRHYEFMSIPCGYCGAYSPLRAPTSFHTSKQAAPSCQKEDIIDYHPGDKLPDNLAYHREKGWIYVYFKDTLSDSPCGQETFRLKARSTLVEAQMVDPKPHLI